MSCPNCGHTMHNLGVEGQRVFWCPHCGTIKAEAGNAPDNISVPKLVGYIREADVEYVSLDHHTRRYALDEWHWNAACEASGRKAKS